MTQQTTPPLDEYGLIDLITGYQPAAAISAASRLGVYDALTDTPQTLAQIAQKANLAEPPLQALLDALAGCGVVQSRSDGYLHTALSARITSGGDLTDLVAKEAFFARVWTDLDETVRTGSPRLAPWRERILSEPDVAQFFLRALITLAVYTGPDLTRLDAFAAGNAVADFGGGFGSYATRLADAGVHVTLVELPVVSQWATAFMGPESSVEVLAGDLLTGPVVPPGSVDTVLVSHLIHDLSDDDALTVLASAMAALRTGGTVVVVELPGDGEGSFGPLFDLMMQIETDGRARSEPELERLLIDSGFEQITNEGYPRPVAVLSGRKPE